jgi:DNA-binding transcriptional ArsR family regulator
LPELAEQYAEIHRVLANRRRILILWALTSRELSVGEIAHVIGASLQSTSQHLRLMRDHAMLCSRREGQTVYYRLQPAGSLPLPVWPSGQLGMGTSEGSAPDEGIKEDSHGRWGFSWDSSCKGC